MQPNPCAQPWRWRESRAHRDTHGWRLSLTVPQNSTLLIHQRHTSIPLSSSNSSNSVNIVLFVVWDCYVHHWENKRTIEMRIGKQRWLLADSPVPQVLQLGAYNTKDCCCCCCCCFTLFETWKLIRRGGSVAEWSGHRTWNPEVPGSCSDLSAIWSCLTADPGSSPQPHL